MFLTPLKIRNERLSICKQCKWFVKSTSSCGPLRPQNLLGAKKVEVDWDEDDPHNKRRYRKKVKLCGCDMTVKTRLAFASCPANKWLAMGEDPDKLTKKAKEIRDFVLPLKNANRIESDQLKQLFRYASEIEGRPVPYTTCPPCIREIINAMCKRLEGVI